jgi:hypothetical protein
MTGLLIRWVIVAVAILLAAYLVDGIQVKGFFSAIFAAAMLGVLNAFFRPILLILTLPCEHSYLRAVYLRDQRHDAQDGFRGYTRIPGRGLLVGARRVVDRQSGELVLDLFYQ